MFEGSLEVKLPTIWTDESREGKSQSRKSEEKRRKNIKEEKDSEARREQVGKSQNTVFFQ